MKNITRVLALLLALILVLGLVVTGFADGASGSSPDTKGKITIDNAVVGQTYSIYKILELESYNAEPGKEAYSYKVAQKWNTFVTTEATDFFEIHNNRTDNIVDGYVSWKDGTDDARVAAFAKAALAYATADVNGNPKIAPDYTITATSETVVFDGNGAGLPLGYYLLDSSLGTLCSLGTTNSEVNIQEKNKAPTNTKQVQEDSKVGKTDEYGTENDADIGQTVNFKSTITAQAGAQNYVFHDTMSEGLTFDKSSVVVKKGDTTLTNNTEYTLKTTDKTDADCTFEIVFTQTFCDTLKADDQIVITYSATLNENAVIGSDGTTSNTNKSKLSYGDNSATEWSQTTTKTWKVSVFKFHRKDATNQTGLEGAKFTLSKSTDGANPINLIKLTDTTKPNTYRVAIPKTETTFEDDAITEITTDTTGKFTIQGLDSDTYYLTEKEAPKGYNKLKDPIAITIDDAGNVKLGETTVENGEVKVENKTGAEMPSTGGIGTTVFYVVGGILAVGAAVLLVTKKRMERG